MGSKSYNLCLAVGCSPKAPGGWRAAKASNATLVVGLSALGLFLFQDPLCCSSYLTAFSETVTPSRCPTKWAGASGCISASKTCERATSSRSTTIGPCCKPRRRLDRMKRRTPSARCSANKTSRSACVVLVVGHRLPGIRGGKPLYTTKRSCDSGGRGVSVFQGFPCSVVANEMQQVVINPSGGVFMSFARAMRGRGIYLALYDEYR